MTKYKNFNSFDYSPEGKLPRKLKKIILGKKLNNKKLKELIQSVTMIRDKKTNDIIDIKPYLFCPNCGCTETRFIDHGVPYPEVWNEDRCLRCDAWVGGCDNSRYYHILEEIYYDRIEHKGEQWMA